LKIKMNDFFKNKQVLNVSRNLTIVALNNIILKIILPGSLFVFAESFESKGLGLFNLVKINWVIEFLLSFLLMDFIMYVWHLINHKNSFFWTFHRAHHTDDVFDPTTAFRFHVIELMLSFGYKLSLIAIFGISKDCLLIYETVFLVFNLNAHCRYVLPERVQIILEKLMITSRLHLVHHSVQITERNKNFGTVLVIWDRVFNTFLPLKIDKHFPTGITGRPNTLKSFLFALN
jgi:sterol desaturase/sphingolipid hydroxylase (fatty acid hydroxylase superfamily)